MRLRPCAKSVNIRCSSSPRHSARAARSPSRCWPGLTSRRARRPPCRSRSSSNSMKPHWLAAIRATARRTRSRRSSLLASSGAATLMPPCLSWLPVAFPSGDRSITWGSSLYSGRPSTYFSPAHIQLSYRRPGQRHGDGILDKGQGNSQHRGLPLRHEDTQQLGDGQARIRNPAGRGLHGGEPDPECSGCLHGLVLIPVATVTVRASRSRQTRRTRDGDFSWPPAGPRPSHTRGLFLMAMDTHHADCGYVLEAPAAAALQRLKGPTGVYARGMRYPEWWRRCWCAGGRADRHPEGQAGSAAASVQRGRPGCGRSWERGPTPDDRPNESASRQLQSQLILVARCSRCRRHRRDGSPAGLATGTSRMAPRAMHPIRGSPLGVLTVQISVNGARPSFKYFFTLECRQNALMVTPWLLRLMAVLNVPPARSLGLRPRGSRLNGISTCSRRPRSRLSAISASKNARACRGAWNTMQVPGPVRAGRCYAWIARQVHARSTGGIREHLPALDRRVQRHDDHLVMIGWPPLPGLVRSVIPPSRRTLRQPS
jgi:hypothetical protein